MLKTNEKDNKRVCLIKDGKMNQLTLDKRISPVDLVVPYVADYWMKKFRETKRESLSEDGCSIVSKKLNKYLRDVIGKAYRESFLESKTVCGELKLNRTGGLFGCLDGFCDVYGISPSAKTSFRFYCGSLVLQNENVKEAEEYIVCIDRQGSAKSYSVMNTSAVSSPEELQFPSEKNSSLRTV